MKAKVNAVCAARAPCFRIALSVRPCPAHKQQASARRPASRLFFTTCRVCHTAPPCAAFSHLVMRAAKHAYRFLPRQYAALVTPCRGNRGLEAPATRRARSRRRQRQRMPRAHAPAHQQKRHARQRLFAHPVYINAEDFFARRRRAAPSRRHARAAPRSARVFASARRRSARSRHGARRLCCRAAAARHKTAVQQATATYRAGTFLPARAGVMSVARGAQQSPDIFACPPRRRMSCLSPARVDADGC